MAEIITLQQLAKLAPNARSSYREAFAQSKEVFNLFGISQSKLRIAHFMAQILHESGGLSIQFENLNYSVERLPKVWPSRFKPKGALDPALYAHNPEKLANEVYGGRMGNNTTSDGYLYRGRGLMQLTGKESYQSAYKIVLKHYANTPNFMLQPDEVISANWCLKVAAAEWFEKGCNAKADTDNVIAVTKAINGGLIGLAERKEWLKRSKALFAL